MSRLPMQTEKQVNFSFNKKVWDFKGVCEHDFWRHSGSDRYLRQEQKCSLRRTSCCQLKTPTNWHMLRNSFKSYQTSRLFTTKPQFKSLCSHKPIINPSANLSGISLGSRYISLSPCCSISLMPLDHFSWIQGICAVGALTLFVLFVPNLLFSWQIIYNVS